MKGLVIKSPWIEMILSGQKVWEIRGSNTNIREKIALIKSKSGMLFGTIDVIDSIKLIPDIYKNNQNKHCVPIVQKESGIIMPYPNTYAWVLSNPTILKMPIPYKHPQGAVIWVNLNNDIERLILNS